MMVFASTLEAVEMLCARGADTHYAFTQETTGSAYSRGEGDPKYELLTSDTQDGPIARCLVRHGTVVNTVYDPGVYGIDFGSYWKNVVMSGGITWAAELLAKYGANADWPSKCDYDVESPFIMFNGVDDGRLERWNALDFSTVLMVAIRKQDL